MTDTLLTQALWWLSVIEIPALAALLALYLHLRNDVNRIEVDTARTYATAVQMRELEQRLTAHLLRIEVKLDTTALKTESAFARLPAGGHHE